MIEFKLSYDVKGPIDDILALLLDRKRDVKIYSNITAVEILKYEATDHSVDFEIKSVANGNIPPTLRKIVTPNMLTWIVKGHWDLKNYSYANETKPLYFTNIFTGTGTQKLTPLGEDKTRYVLKFYYNIRLPILGAIAEKIIAKTQKENTDHAVKILEQDIAEAARNRNKPGDHA